MAFACEITRTNRTAVDSYRRRHANDLEASGIGSAGASLAGQSFLPRLRDQPQTSLGSKYFQYMDNRAIRTDEWTLAEVDGAGWELYAAADVSQRNDVASKHPDVVKRLETDWQTWWTEQSGEANYIPKSTTSGPHYAPQGDRGSGKMYTPSAMPTELSTRYPIPK